MIEIIPAKSKEDFESIAQLADTIWREYYIPMVGKPQVDYMLENFQSVKAISNQHDGGFEYFIISFNTVPVSYIAVKKEEETLFLSKIYVLKNYRGKKIGKAAMQFIVEKAKIYQLNRIKLYVNVGNANAIIAYETLGFVKVDNLKVPIGEGFFTDDFIMEKTC